MKFATTLLSAAALMAGCSSINSIPAPSGANDGLTYFMPRKDIVVTVVKANGKLSTVSLDLTPAYPDLSTAFILSFSKNLVGKNEINIGVATNGLLTSTKSTTTSGVSDVLKGLGESIGTLAGLAAPAAAAPVDKCVDGTHTFIVDPQKAASGTVVSAACGLSISVKKLGISSAPQHMKAAQSSESGIFYRQAEPYLVEATGVLNSAAILMSPSGSNVHFLPVTKTLFSNNQADFGFTDGMPTKYDQSADGEIVALAKLPAEVIAAYFGAVGKVFDSFKANDTSKGDSLAASIKLELAKKKYDACIAAIQAKDDTALQQLECGK